MTRPNRKSAAVAITLAVLLASSNVHAQNASEPLVSAASLQGIQQQLNALRTQVTALQASNAALQSQLAAVRANPVLALGPFVRVDPNPEVGVAGPNVIFHGVNVHIVSGSGYTNDNGNARGLGNLILGYDESPTQSPVTSPLNAGDRGGSHNLVIGRYHRFTQSAFGGLVAGEHNFIGNVAASVTGGFTNGAVGEYASVTGGLYNSATTKYASVTGGGGNVASGGGSSVSGGTGNVASGDWASVAGGKNNTASGWNASVIGGFQTTSGGRFSVVLGGTYVGNNKDNSIAPQPPFPNFP